MRLRRGRRWYVSGAGRLPKPSEPSAQPAGESGPLCMRSAHRPSHAHLQATLRLVGSRAVCDALARFFPESSTRPTSSSWRRAMRRCFRRRRQRRRRRRWRSSRSPGSTLEGLRIVRCARMRACTRSCGGVSLLPASSSLWRPHILTRPFFAACHERYGSNPRHRHCALRRQGAPRMARARGCSDGGGNRLLGPLVNPRASYARFI